MAEHLPPHRVWAALEGIEPHLTQCFDVPLELEGNHPEKLNQLASRISDSAHPEDLLLFIDGDAFPIRAIDENTLRGRPLAAVRRDENLGDPQPHPSFCLTTVGYWNDIEGDWRPGFRWQSTTGELATDTGGNLLKILQDRGDEWTPLLRSNSINLHPLWFAIYSDCVYHHGAGFRPPISRLGISNARRSVTRTQAVTPYDIGTSLLGRVRRSLTYRSTRRREMRTLERAVRVDQDLSDEVFGWLAEDPLFYLRFIQKPSGTDLD